MAQSPKYKVYRNSDYVGCVKDATDAAVLVSIQENGTVRLGHKRVLWTEGVDGYAGESYDVTAETILDRESAATRRI